MTSLGNRLGNRLGNSLGNSVASAGGISAILGSNLRFLVDSRLNASSSTWTDQVSGTRLTGANSPTLAALAPYYNGNPVFAFNGTNQTFDSGTIGTAIVAAGAKPYMWLVAQHVAAATGGTTTRIASLRTPGVEEQLGIGDIAGNRTTNGRFTGNVQVGSQAAPQAFPSFWEVFYDTNGARSIYRDGTLVATGATATTSTAIQRVQIGGRADLADAFCNCTVAQLGICTTVPTAVQRAALLAAAIRDFDTGPKTISQVLGANLKFRVVASSGWSAGAWVDTVGGLSLTGAGTPTRVADGTNFRGASVVTFNGTTQGYSGAAGADIVATSARPYMFIVMRQITGSVTANKVAVTFDNPVTAEIVAIGDNAASGTSTSGRIVNTNLGAVAIPQAAPSFWEVYLTSAGVRTFDRDGTNVATNGTGISTSVALRTVSIGASQNTIQFAQCIVAEMGICTSDPGATTRGVLKAMSQEAWGTP